MGSLACDDLTINFQNLKDNKIIEACNQLTEIATYKIRFYGVLNRIRTTT